MHLRELLDNAVLTERDKALRRGFAPYCPDLDVAGEEYTALVVLLNLTLKRDQMGDLCDELQARQLLLDDKHLARCVGTVRWQHSHNLKYPDSRVSGQRLIMDPPPQIPGVVTSAGLEPKLGWAHNSADINLAKLFGTSFRHLGVTTNLALQLTRQASVWLEAFARLGMSSTAINELQAQLSHALAAECIPLAVSPYSKQVRFIYQHDYCAITPVVSHTLLASLQALIYQTRCPHLSLEHAHPASLGSLVGAVGGKIAVLHYPPPVGHATHRGFSQSRAQRLAEAKSLFDQSVLYDRIFIDSLDHLISPQGPTRRQRKQQRLSALRYLRRQLAVWLGPIIEWRDEVQQDLAQVEKLLPESLERKILMVQQSAMPELCLEVAARFHLELQSHPVGRRYAYHPDLIGPIKTQLRWLLTKLAEASDATEGRPKEQRCYLHFSGLRVYDAVALANPYLCGLPSLSALAGFTHDYERRLSALLQRKVQIDGVAWYLRHYQLSSAKLLPEPSTPVSVREVSAIRTPGLIDSRYCDLGMDLVLELWFPEDGTAPTTEEQTLLQAAFPSRFAGGCLHPPSLYEGKSWCNCYEGHSELFNAVSRLPRTGCWVYPYRSDITDLEGLIATLEADSRLRPVSSGYVLLEEPTVRSGSLEGHHAYAESAIGLALCVNPVEMRLGGMAQFFADGFWHMRKANRAMLMQCASNMEKTHGAMQAPEL